MSGAFVGTSVGGMVMSPIAEWIIRTWGWRTAFAAAGVEMLVFVLPVVLFVIRARPSELGLEPYRDAAALAGADGENWGYSPKEALSLKVFWKIAAIMLILGVVTGGLGNNCPAYLQDIGHSSRQAAWAWSMVMGVMILGKLAIGPVADRWGPKNAMAGASILFAVSIVILLFAQPYWVALLFAALYGFACGAPLVINPLLTSTYLGMRNFGALYGILNMMGTVGGSLGPAGAGFYHDKYHTYQPVFYFFIAIMVVCSIVALLIKPASRSITSGDRGAPTRPR
jgi:MFS family permease